MTTTPFAKSLERRISDLERAITAQEAQLAAYKKVLELEAGTHSGSHAGPPMAVSAPHVSHHPAAAPVQNGAVPAFGGNKAEFVANILKARRPNGVSSREIAQAFHARKIKLGKNLIYNVVSLLFQQKKVAKRNGLYYYIGSDAAASAVSKAPVAAAPAKPRISEEGMKRIIAATKKRWAKQKAAEKAKGKAK